MTTSHFLGPILRFSHVLNEIRYNEGNLNTQRCMQCLSQEDWLRVSSAYNFFLFLLIRIILRNMTHLTTKLAALTKPSKGDYYLSVFVKPTLISTSFETFSRAVEHNLCVMFHARSAVIFHPLPSNIAYVYKH